MAVALEQFVKQLADSGVIAPGKLESFVPPKAQPKDAQELARLLVQSKCLTKFQAQEIYSGRAKSLILGNYTLVDKIGAGGMGQVYKAEHRRMHRTVAIKVLPTTLTKDPATIARFQREVEAAAKLEHPNIVTAYDADEAGGVHFLVMQYVEGSDLSALVKKNGPFPIDKAVNYILQAAKGLEFAHSEGVVHRDIKPANLLLDKKGAVKILDMGLARISGGDAETQAELTGTGAVMGTVDYMAPEQALSTKHADARADIYSLGCTLYYLVSGHAAYDGDTLMAKLLAHREKPIPSLGPEASDELQAVFARMVAKKVEDRYQTISEVVADLQECSAAKSTVEEPLSASESSLGDSNLSFLAEATAHTHQHSPTKPAKPTKKAKQTEHAAKPAKTSSGWKRRKLLLVGGGLLGGLIVMAGVIFKMPTKDGMLVVEVNQPDATVQVLDDSGKVEITQPGENGTVSISVDPGKHRLKVEKDGFQFYTQDFVMESGGQQSIKAALEPLAVDLLKLIDPRRDAANGRWTRTGQAIDSPSISYACLQVPYDPPRRYELDADIERLEVGPGHGSANLGLVVDGHPTVIVIDANSTTSLWLADAPLNANSTTSHGAIFPVGKRVAIKVIVRPRSVRLLADGKQIFDWHGDPKKLLLTADWEVPDRRKLFIGAFDNRFRYHALQLIPLAEDSSESSDAPGAQPWNAPAFQQWMKEIAAQPAEKQVEAVAKKLQELNPGFDGKVTGWNASDTPRIDGGVVTQLGFVTDNVTDISAVRALRGLTWLSCPGSRPGKGALSDLSPLKGMPLTVLGCGRTHVTDLSPLKGMPLTSISIGKTQVADLSALKGMPLTSLACNDTSVSDLSSLAGTELTQLIITPRNSTKGMDIIRQMKSLEIIGIDWDNKWPPAEFWKKYDAGEFGKPVARGKPTTNIDDPAFQQWMKEVAARPAEKQVDAVAKRLVELNPGFDGKVTGWELSDQVNHETPQIENGVATEIGFIADNVTDISPVRALLGLKRLMCKGSGHGAAKLTDLSPLKGMQLTAVDCSNSKVSDLSPLKGMPLTICGCTETNVADLSPLAGMPLEQLWCGGSLVSDLSPLKEMPLRVLACDRTRVNDLSPLQGLNLERVFLTSSDINKGMDAIRQMKSLTMIGTSGGQIVSPTEFWKKYDAGEFGKPAAAAKSKLDDPAFQKWMKDVAAQPAEKQVEAVAKKLQDLNPGFDGKVTGADGRSPPKIENGVVTELQFVTDNVTDIAPVRALPGLRNLACAGSNSGRGILSDLSPLQGMRLTKLNCGWSPPLADLSPLRGMPLTFMGCLGTQVVDLSPLEGMALTTLYCSYTPVSDLSPLKRMKLALLECCGTPVSDLSPLHGMPLTYLDCHSTRVDDLSPLHGMPLTTLMIDGTAVADLKALGGMPLTGLNCEGTRVFDLSPLTGLPLTRLRCSNTQVSDLSPLHGMPLTTFECERTQVSDLSGLKGMPLTTLNCNRTAVSDLSPLRGTGMPLTKLYCGVTKVSDLSPLAGLPLREFNCGGSQVSDLSPLKGMRLTFLACNDSNVSDLSPLDGMTLTQVFVTPRNITKGIEVLRQMTSLNRIGYLPTAEFWKLYDAGEFNPATFQQWMKSVAALPADKQLEAVAQKLQTLNPGFDGKLTGGDENSPPKIENGVVTELQIRTGNVSDISPLRALTGLKKLWCVGNGPFNGSLFDLSPLKGLHLTFLNCGFNIENDLSALQEMKLDVLHCGGTYVSDLTPLKEMPLTALWCQSTRVADLTPLRGIPLTTLACLDTQVSNLSPLDGMKLTEVYFSPKKITQGLDVIRRMPSVATIGTDWNQHWPAAEFWRIYDTGELGKPSAAGKSTLDDPAFQQWMKEVAKLPAAEQAKAVVKKLQELNPGYDGAVQGWNGVGNLRIQNGVVTEFGVFNSPVADISPVRALTGLKVFSGQAQKVNDLTPLSGLPLIDLSVVGSAVTDLSPLKGMKLAALHCDSTGVADLSPLKGMPLKVLLLGGTKVSDLTALKGLPLETLNLGGAKQVADLSPLTGMKLKFLATNGNKVSDLSPLAGMPLETLLVSETSVSDLTPLQGMSLKGFGFTPANITRGIEVIRQMKSVERISNTWTRNPMHPAEFWKKYDAGEFGKPAAAAKSTLDDPEFQKWLKAVAALPAGEQVKEVVKKLQEQNPGYDGKEAHKIENGSVTELKFNSDSVSNILPVRALARLSRFDCSGDRLKGKLSDLSALRGMPLTALYCNNNPVADLSPIAGMPLGGLSLDNSGATDLSPLKGMPLTFLDLHGSRGVHDLAPLRGAPLGWLDVCGTGVSDLSPLDGMPLQSLYVVQTPISDLTPLARANLNNFSSTPKNITRGLDILRQMKSLKQIGDPSGSRWPPAEFWKKYDAGEFGKPAGK